MWKMADFKGSDFTTSEIGSVDDQMASIPSTATTTSSRGSMLFGEMRDSEAPPAGKHAEMILHEWNKLLSLSGGNSDILLDGTSLDVPSVVAVSRYGVATSINETQMVISRIQESVEYLQAELARGECLYGITTGFGGSADTRTNSVKALQVGLLQMQLSGILPSKEDKHQNITMFDRATPNSSYLSTLAMPESWVRSAMLIRCNSLIRGHSGVRITIIENLVKLLKHNYVPFVPLRGSISASGDLSPLSYIAGVLEGNPDVQVWTDGPDGSRQLISAKVALTILGLEPVVFQAKEGLGVLNGTAVSAGVATLALHEANHLAILSQILTAMGVEALAGEASSFEAFIAKIRPHPGQVEVAENISRLLQGSKLLRKDENHEDGELRQDRYALRTSSQWLGPQLEDLLLARSQLNIELNSTTDNPLIDVADRKIHHGGNFQAAAVTSSTEKTRSALQMIGKMLFAQSCELLDVHQNNGLPPNLAADEPSLSYTLKGVDINMAAYMSELAFLTNPVSSHVQSAEMGNQAINSLALISARYTHTAIDVLSLMCSAYLYSLCQALDLRVMQAMFLGKLRPTMEKLNRITFEAILNQSQLQKLNSEMWPIILKSLSATICKDSSDRFLAVANAAHTLLIDTLLDLDHTDALPLIRTWTQEISATIKLTFIANRKEYTKNPDATAYLGKASRSMYTFVRHELQVPFHKGLCDHPVGNGEDEKLRTTGSRISVIYEALRTGRLMVPAMKCLEEGKDFSGSNAAFI
ncbi:phenylalanine ammonia-lyase [Phlyctema vagabunda]|uniref:Phenylalanine ammonia-lyase n=1 Tax=Phlyctema vagabunda TaxID=108571 RepID=A0ABR4PUH5_9HELO